MMTVIRSCDLELDLVLEEEVSSAVNGDSIDDDLAMFVEWQMSLCLRSMVVLETMPDFHVNGKLNDSLVALGILLMSLLTSDCST